MRASSRKYEVVGAISTAPALRRTTRSDRPSHARTRANQSGVLRRIGGGKKNLT